MLIETMARSGVTPSRVYEDYYMKQAGSALSVYHGGPMQTGYGLRNVLGGLFKRALPLIKKGATTLGKQMLETGSDILDDALSGKKIKAATKNA